MLYELFLYIRARGDTAAPPGNMAISEMVFGVVAGWCWRMLAAGFGCLLRYALYKSMPRLIRKSWNWGLRGFQIHQNHSKSILGRLVRPLKEPSTLWPRYEEKKGSDPHSIWTSFGRHLGDLEHHFGADLILKGGVKTNVIKWRGVATSSAPENTRAYDINLMPKDDALNNKISLFFSQW